MKIGVSTSLFFGPNCREDEETFFLERYKRRWAALVALASREDLTAEIADTTREATVGIHEMKSFRVTQA